MAEQLLPIASLSEIEAIARKFVDATSDFAINLVVAALILLVTIWASRSAAALARRLMARVHRLGPPDPTLQTFFGSLTRYLILVVGLVAVLHQLGVQTTSVIAVLGAASLAIGLALQGALSNVAAGVMILVLRPYRVGDAIEAAGKQGVVRALDLFVTELATYDNVRVFLPNSKVLGEVITNFSTHATRRVDVVFRSGLIKDANASLARLLEAARADERVMKEPAPLAEVSNIGEVWVECALRLWVQRASYQEVRAHYYGLAAREVETHPAAS